MNRALALAAMLALVAVPAAFAASLAYQGKVTGDGGSSVTLKINRDDGIASFRSFVARDFKIGCEDDTNAQLSSARISGSVEVNDSNRFKVEGEDGKIAFTVAGRLRGQRSAKGSFTYEGPTEVDGDVLECASGKLRWKASR